MSSTFDRFAQHARAERGGFFDRERSITLTRARGWIDLFGGIVADAGILSLLWPVDDSVMVALQPDPEPIIRFWIDQRVASIPCTALLLPSGPREYTDAVAEIDRHQPPRSPWWGPALMAWVALMREEFARFGGGARVMVQCNSSSPAASVIAAVAQALVTAYGIHVAPRELAITCAEGLARLERRSTGTELIGTLTTICAPANELVIVNPLTAHISSSAHLPASCAFWTMQVGDEPRQHLARVRAALTHIERLLGARDGEPALASLSISDFIRHQRSRLPMTLAPSAYPHHLPPAALAAFALAEQQRARLALALLRAAASRVQRDDDLRLVGELLTQSHWEQAVLGLTDPHADTLIEQLTTLA
ncbi:MAG: hypothetical protein ACK44M_13180, partial [Chloroflexus sp.]